MPTAFFNQFPLDLAALLASSTSRVQGRPGTGGIVTLYTRGPNCLLLRLKGAERVSDLVGRPVVAAWSMTKVTPKATLRRPVLTLIQTECEHEVTATERDLMLWLIEKLLDEQQ